MRIASLGSGSKGNATLVQHGDTTLLIDNGFSLRKFTQRLERFEIDPNMIMFKYMTVYGSMGYTPSETQQALKLIAGGSVDRDLLITAKVPLEETPQAFKLQANPAKSLKVMIVNDE